MKILLNNERRLQCEHNQLFGCAAVTYEGEFAPPMFTFAPVPEKSSPADHDVVAFASDDTAGVDDDGFAQSGSPYAPLMVAFVSRYANS